jgi:hypothetical protein
MGDMDFVLRARDYGCRVMINIHARIYGLPGKNYLFYQLVHGSTTSILRSFLDLKSSIYWRTRFFFILRHTKPQILAPIAALYFIIRMMALVIVKLITPKPLIISLAHRLYGNEIYEGHSCDRWDIVGD